MSPFNNVFDEKPRRAWKYWPIRVEWNPKDITRSFFSWHDWPLDGPSIWLYQPYLEYGWTLHFGALKIHFGG